MNHERLETWLSEHIQNFAGPATVSRFSGGQSNPTYRISTPDLDYVLRRKPAGVLAPGAHAIEREARVMQALEAQGFIAPHVHALCEDEAIMGTPFYVMAFVKGRIFWSAEFPGEPREQRRLYFDAMNETLARLHRIDPIGAGLGDFGKPGNYFARQISRWSRQYKADEEAGRNTSMDWIIEWLPSNIPDGDETAIVHGDYRVDNLVFDPSEAKVIAVLDWELSTLGHPLADFVNHLMMYRLPRDILSGLAGVDLAAVGLPSEADYIAAYCARTGRNEIDNLNFYMSFCIFRLAAIYHGIRGRALRGNASSEKALEFSAHFPRLAELAQSIALGEG